MRMSFMQQPHQHHHKLCHGSHGRDEVNTAVPLAPVKDDADGYVISIHSCVRAKGKAAIEEEEEDPGTSSTYLPVTCIVLPHFSRAH
eukprot:873803-Amphidinium_carterae.1